MDKEFIIIKIPGMFMKEDGVIIKKRDTGNIDIQMEMFMKEILVKE